MSDFLDLQGAKDLNTDAIHIGAVANSKNPVTGAAIDTHVNRKGGTDYTLQGFYKALGPVVMPWTSVTGGTLTQPNQAFLHPTNGNYYSWTGAYPKVVAPGTDPTSAGSGYVPRTDVVFRAEITPSVTEALRRSYAEAGYNLVAGSFELGGTVTTATDVLLHEAEWVAYSWGGTLPKVVAAGSAPASAGGTGPTAWTARDTAQLRTQLSGTTGAGLIGLQVPAAGSVPTNSLVRLLNCLYVKADFGAKGDGISDDTAALNAAAQYAVDHDKTLVFEEGTYLFNTIQARSSTIRKASTEWIALGDVKLVSTKAAPNTTDYDADYAIRIIGTYHSTVSLVADAVRNAGLITLSDVTGIEEGDLLSIQTTRLIQTDHRGQAREGQICKVSSVNPGRNTVGLHNTLRIFCAANRNQSGTVTSAVSGAEFTTTGLTLTRRNSNVRIRFTSGANAGQIRYVTGFSGSTLYIGGRQSAFPFTPASGDAFTLEWVTDVGVIKPIKFNMRGNFNISRVFHTNAVAGDVGFRGLDIIFSDNAHIDGVTVERFSETCIRLRGSYQPSLLNATVKDANRSYNDWDGTGYGVSVNQCFGALVDNAHTYRCRRGIDVAGTQAISWETRVTNCTASGGGVAYTNEAFWPNGPAQNSGMGSHGASYGTLYSNNTVVDCHLPYAVRGLRERFTDCHVVGYVADRCLYLRYGGALVVDGLTYDDSFTEIGIPGTLSYNEDSRPTKRALSMVEISCATDDGYLRTYPVTIKNCIGKKVRLCMLRLTGAGDTLTAENIYLGNNIVYVSSEDIADSNEFSFVRTEGLKVIKNFFDLGGNRYLLDGGTFTNWNVYDLRTSMVIPDNSYIRLAENKYACTIADNSVITIPFNTKTKMAMISIFDHERDRNYRAINILAGVEVATDFSPLQASNKIGVELSASVLTGTTGNLNKVTIAFMPSGGSGNIYIENRMGMVLRPIIVIESVPH